MTLEDLKKVQETDTELLFHVADICERNDIQYVMVFGTLLGAIRHGGPIPWDDDVDIAMTRENYLKFLSVANAELDQSKYVLTIMGSGSTEYVSEIKIGKKGTLYCMQGTEHLDIMKKIQLDIFLIDYVKELSPLQVWLYDKIRKVLKYAKLGWGEKKLLFFCAEQSTRRFKWVYKCGLLVLHGLRSIVGEKTMERWIYQMYVDTTGKSSQMGIVYDSTAPQWEADDINNPVFVDYASRPLLAPNHSEQWLTKQFGDYMQYPPENKRLRNGFDTWICEFDVKK